VDEQIQDSEAKIEALAVRLVGIQSSISQKGKAAEKAHAERQQLNAPLQDIGPVLDDACAAVEGLTRLHVNEVKGLKNPPLLVRKTIEMVYLLFHAQNLANRSMPTIPKMDWKDDCCRMLARRDFIQRILLYPDIQEGQSAVGSGRKVQLGGNVQEGSSEVGTSASVSSSASGRQVPSFHPLASYPMILNHLRANYYDEREGGDNRAEHAETMPAEPPSLQGNGRVELLPGPIGGTVATSGVRGASTSPGSRRAGREGRLTMRTVGGIVGIGVRSPPAKREEQVMLTLKVREDVQRGTGGSTVRACTLPCTCAPSTSSAHTLISPSAHSLPIL
jgi:hypothetical protein